MNPETKTLGELIASEDEQVHRNAWSILKRLINQQRAERRPSKDWHNIVKSPSEANK
jgi:hypothetical protein